MTLLLIVLLILILLGVPAYHYRGDYGYGPGGLVGLLIVVILVVLLLRLAGVVVW